MFHVMWKLKFSPPDKEKATKYLSKFSIQQNLSIASNILTRYTFNEYFIGIVASESCCF